MYKILEKILSRSFKSATKIQLSKDSKFIFFSDVHKGNNGHGDDFAHNRNIYYHALRTYFEGGYSYFELGDGIELWENNKFEDIFEAHEDIFLLMKDFYLEERLHLLWGNHDMVLRNPNKVKKLFGKYFDKNTGDIKLLMEKLTFDESIVLEVDGKEKNILLIHGHQADLFNYVFWKFNRPDVPDGGNGHLQVLILGNDRGVKLASLRHTEYHNAFTIFPCSHHLPDMLRNKRHERMQHTDEHIQEMQGPLEGNGIYGFSIWWLDAFQVPG